MCITSFVHDEYSKAFPPSPSLPAQWTNLFQTSASHPPKTALDLFEELIRIAKQLDAALGLPDCEDEHKTAWMAELRRQVREHEAAKIDKRLGE